MKEHGSKHPAEVPARALKSLLKKPGQSKTKAQKNRVVINEKLNEFFAADYIILIKEECCADYEEDCDCCCQEHEMIRLGNCKECRAELNLHFAAGNNGRFAEPDCQSIGGRPQQQFRCEESQDDEEEGDEEEEENEDEDEDEEEESVDEVDSRADRCPVSPPRLPQQQETLSPPEGYKDVCEEAEIPGERHLQPTCTECTYYHQRTTGLEEQTKVNGSAEGMQNNGAETKQHVDEETAQQTNDQAQQTTPDLHQRYLVETITMTTVTERRIVREISEEESRPGIEESDQSNARRAVELPKDDEPSVSLGPGQKFPRQEDSTTGQKNSEDAVAEKTAKNVPDGDTGVGEGGEGGGAAEGAEDKGGTERTDTKENTPDASELSLTFKLGNVSLVTNSLKPNSAVRQLFPDPRFISPPPAAVNKAISSMNHVEDPEEDGQSEAQKFLITTESLRLFDAVKRSKIAGSRSDSSESESSTIKRNIERNTLRRSLIGKYDTFSRKKNLRSKDLSLEERIRQLTCVDQDEENTESSASENTNTLEESEHATEFPVRTSPSGEEHPKNDRVTQSLSSSTITTTSTMTTPSNHDHSSLSLPLTSVNGQANVHHSQSTYRKITDLFAQKRTMETNLPDIGLGNGARTLSKEYSKNPLTKMNSDVRKQFLATLAPLSCVTSNSTDNHEDYYRIASRMTSGNNRDSIGYNSDSSYSLEDIEAVLNGDERNYIGPPDVTRGTPTGTGADVADNTADELLAFVEQDKSRTERIKRRYNESEDRHDDPSVNGDLGGLSEDTNVNNNEDDDDELNDYGFNRRPSVRGIKPQFGTTDEIVQQLRSRSLPPNTFVDVRTSFHATWPVYYDKNGEKVEGKPDEENINDGTYAVLGKDDRETNTINRINTMQKQIDDIYQTIAETTVNVQGSLDRAPYLDGTLPRPLVSPMVRIPPTDGTVHRYPEQKNGQIHYQEQTNARMLRIAGGADEISSAVYANNIQAKVRRHPAVTIANYHCNVLPATAGGAKCYRTMYFVPYNGISDPTYQNIQRILPPHSSPNYATHIERYPYPRQARTDQPQPPRYYARTLAPGSNMVPPAANPLPPHAAQQTLHLHLHHHQPEDFRVPPGLPGVPHGTVHPLQLQHHHQHHQIGQYHVQSVPPAAYSVVTPPKCSTTVSGPVSSGYHLYQLHLGRSAADVQTQTVSSLTSTVPNNCGTLLTATFNGGHAASSSSSSSSPALSSPTKIQQRPSSCIVAERGVPEGAASAPAHDFSQAASNVSASTAYVSNAVAPPANAQNSVYYAMNV